MSVQKESTNQDIRKKENKKHEVNDDKIPMNSLKQEENTDFNISSLSNNVNTEVGAQEYDTDCHVTGEKNQASNTKESACTECSNDKEDMMNNVKTFNNSNKSEDNTQSGADKDQKSALNKVTEGASGNEDQKSALNKVTEGASGNKDQKSALNKVTGGASGNKDQMSALNKVTEGANGNKSKGMKSIEPVDVENKNIKDVRLNSGNGDATQLSFISAKSNDDTDDKHKQNIEADCNSETVSKQQVDVKDDKASTSAKAKNKKYVKPEDAKGNFYNNIQNKQSDKRNKQQNQNDQVKTDEKNKRDPKASKGGTRDSNKKPKENAALRQKAFEAYEFFWRSHSPYSQWYPSDFTVDGIKFNCAEQFMMYSKAVLFGDEQTAEKILITSDPRKQKDLGRLVENFDKSLWDDSCSAIVERGNKAKFSQNKELETTILKTFPKMLVEASPQDKIWGIGLEEKNPLAWDCKTWKGQNLLGKALTKVRDELMEIETSQNTVCTETTKEERTTENTMKRLVDSDPKKIDEEETSLSNNSRAEKITDV